MNGQAHSIYEFGPFRLLPAERQLLNDGRSVSLPPKAFDTLLILVQHSGHVLRKDDLIKKVWPDSFVEESNLNHYISVLRKTLNYGTNGDGYIETVRGYGFRFNADVKLNYVETNSLLTHRHTRTHVVFKEEESESLRTVSSTQEAVGSYTRVNNRLLAISGFLLVILIAGSAAAYFGYIGPTRSRNAEPRSVRPSTVGQKTSEDPAARAAYLRGRVYWKRRTADDMSKAAYEFRRALEIDPNYAPAYAGLADCVLLGAPSPVSESAKALAMKALAIDDSLAEAHATLAYYQSAYEWDWWGAEREFQQAITLDPEYVTARHWHAYNLASLGRLDEALSEIRKAHELDPVSVNISTDVGQFLYFAQRYDEAIAQYLKALELDRNFRVAHVRLSEAYTQAGKHEQAASELQEVIRLDPTRRSEMDAWLAFAAAVNGGREDALKILNRLKVDAEVLEARHSIASIYAGLGDRDSAFVWLEKAINAHEPAAALFKVDPMLKNLRNDPRFEQLLRRVNLSSG
jgi:DNA-binding winged helix-turn-helix (wHTH) protein/Tfp pilus assembly protein PilF